MSSSGDEGSEIVEAENVPRRRSGRATRGRKPAARKTPVKRAPAKATRASRRFQEVEEPLVSEESAEEVPSNGFQRTEEPNLIDEQQLGDSESAAFEQLDNAGKLMIEQQLLTLVEPEEQPLQEPEEEEKMNPLMMEDDSAEKGEMQESNTSDDIVMQMTNDNSSSITQVDSSFKEYDDSNKGNPITLDDESVDKIVMLDGDNAQMDIGVEMISDNASQCTEFSEHLIAQEAHHLQQQDNSESVTEEHFQTTEPMEESESLPIQEQSEATNCSESNDNAETMETNEVEDAGIEQTSSEFLPEKTEPDTEAVSEDELPQESTKEPETEAVSDEELPAAATADLGETESVSEDELPPDSDKKKRSKLRAVPIEVKSGGKRKLNAEGEYDPSSPTSENNDEAPAKKIALSGEGEADDDKLDAKPASPKKKTLPELDKYWKAVNEDPSDFTGWTYLLQYVDQESDAEAAREAYTKFLERYPYCYGYWRKFADYEKKKGNPENVQSVFDQGLKAISLSVDLWLHYINHCKTLYESDEDKMREQYERAIEACGLEFRSDRLWDSYIKWETENNRLNRVLGLYDRLLATPTLGYTTHFETFQEFVSSNQPNRLLSVDDFLAIRAEVKSLLKTDDAAAAANDDAPPGEELPPHELPPTDEETRAIREKIISSRRKMHKANVNAVAARWTYEEGIKRPYFHVKPLERCQLKNWKEYLDYEIEQKDQNRITILFERCLIACALYDDFWLRFIRYLESIKGASNEEKIRDVYTRACTVHHPKKPNLHLQWATFEETQGDCEKAAEILLNIDSALPNTLQIAYRRINLERRRGDLDKACSLYEHYISNSKNRTIANNIAVKYARFLCKINGDIDKAIKVLIKATDKDKDNPRLYLQLIDLGLQRNPVDTQEIIGYMDLFIDREHADLEQRVLFAQRKVEFLEDFSPDIRQVMKAHEQFQKCIKQAKERKKSKSEDSKNDSSPPKKAKSGDQTSAPPPPSVSSPSTYQYSSGPSGPYQSQQQFPSGQYSGQSGYQQGYQQYPPPSDPNYANYQSWQYGQSGPQAYGPYGNQWSSYNYY